MSYTGDTFRHDNEHTVVYSKSMPHTPFCCLKYSVVHGKMQIMYPNLSTKMVSIYLWAVFTIFHLQ